MEAEININAIRRMVFNIFNMILINMMVFYINLEKNFYYQILNILIILKYFYFKYLYTFKGIGDWGLGIGDWGLGIGPNPQSPIPNPQSPIPNPQSPLPNPQSPIPNPQSPIPNPPKSKSLKK